MLHYLSRTIKKSSLFWGSTLVISLLLSSIPTSLMSIQTTKLTTEQTISQFARGSYDILVRPVQSDAKIKKTKGFVEENYLTGGLGGISLTQYKQIQNIKGVDVAAPIAVLGFFTSNTGGVNIDLPREKNQAHITTITIQNKTGLSSNYNLQDTTNLVTLPYQNDPFYPSRECNLQLTPDQYQVALTLPDQYNLIVAVDPQQESKLVGENSGIGSLPTELSYEDKKNPDLTAPTGKKLPVIPLMLNQEVKTPLTITVERRNVSDDLTEFHNTLKSINNLSDINSVTRKYLKTDPVTTRTVDLSNELKPFTETKLEYNQDGTISPSHFGETSYLNTSVYYLTDGLNYNVSTDGFSDFTLVPEVNGSKTTYRELDRAGLSLDQAKRFALFDTERVGTFDPAKFTNKKLDPSPLGIYSFSPMKLIQDAQGHPTNVNLNKDMTPDTFLPIEATALTNLQAAALLKGKNPIEAIRVRVAGIDKYDDRAQATILKVADEIEKATGLHTDVVAGASQKNMKISVPKVSSVPAVGIVQEVWTTLGVATNIKNVINTVSIWITIATGLLVILYAVVHTQTLLIIRRSEFNLLFAIGWSKKDIRRLLLMEWGVKIVLAIIVSALLQFLLKLLFGISSHWLLVIGLQVLISFLLLATVYFFVNALQERNLQLGKSYEWKRNPLSPKSIWNVARGNLLGQIFYHIQYLLLTLGSGGVALFTFNVLIATHDGIDTTFLGNAVNVAANQSQWLLVGASVILVFFGVVEASRALIVKRTQEIFVLKIVGWSVKAISQVIILENMIVFIGGLVLAYLFGLLAYMCLYSGSPHLIWIQIGFGVILLSVLFVMTFLLVRHNGKE